MQNQKVLFVGGSRCGMEEMPVSGPYTFVNGALAHPDKDGCVEKSINATIEHYVRDEPANLKVDGYAVYFLDELDQHARDERLAELVRSMAL